MYINKVVLKNFRNYDEEEILLNKNINIFYGDNAQGKTNLLEAISFCGFGKSFRTSKEKELIKKEKDFLKIETYFQRSDRDGKIKIEIADKKVVYLNDIKLKKLSELLGNINLVIFSPDDINLLKSGPNERRRFLDMMIGQLRPGYLLNLNLYLKTLEQRNNFLKKKMRNKELLDIWNEKLIDYGEKIYNYRNEFIEKIKEKIVEIHSEITDEKIDINYKSDCYSRENFFKKLTKNEEIDYIRGFTSSGVHRDDFSININGEPVNIYGSQGQNRTAILSLKLAELNVIKEDVGEYPILLLDDFMSELDEKRITRFLNSIEDIQVIITCTKNIEIKNSTSHKVENGKIN